MQSPFIIFLIGLMAFAVAAWGLRRWTKAITEREGMSRSISGRTGQIGALMTRSFFRKLKLRIKQVLSSREQRKQLESQYHLKTAEEAAKTMGQMKGVFMKIGQIMSFANESLPPEAQKALSGLQQAAPPMDYSLVAEVIEAELGDAPEKIFKSFDKEPLAAASIGQVHRAKLKDGTDVVLKVQYPGVDEAIEADLKASSGLAAMIGAVNRNIDAKAVVEELKEVIRYELDYRQEARSQQLFYDLWDGHPLIHVPKVYPDFSTKRVLCQEYRRGLSFQKFLEQATDKEKQLAVRVLHDFVFDSMNRFCVFNGDPHPGNYLFHEDGGITFLDYGCIKYFEPSFMRGLLRMNRTLIENDIEAFEESCKEMKLILPGRPYDIQKIWSFMRYNGAPFIEDREFEFTREWLAEAKEMMKPDNVWQMNLPKDMLFFNRITFGLNAIMHQLGARENFHRFNLRYVYEDKDGPPSLADVVELPERFRSASMQPAPHVLKDPLSPEAERPATSPSAQRAGAAAS